MELFMSMNITPLTAQTWLGHYAHSLEHYKKCRCVSCMDYRQILQDERSYKRRMRFNARLNDARDWQDKHRGVSGKLMKVLNGMTKAERLEALRYVNVLHEQQLMDEQAEAEHQARKK